MEYISIPFVVGDPPEEQVCRTHENGIYSENYKHEVCLQALHNPLFMCPSKYTVDNPSTF